MNERTKTIVFGPWTIHADVAATRHCYQQTQEVPVEGCGCDPCRNFALVREQAYPQEIVALFDELGIDRQKPFELSHYCRCLRDFIYTVAGSISVAPLSVDPNRTSRTHIGSPRHSRSN